MSLRTFTQNFRLLRHFEGMLDPIYEEGYLATNSWESPYPKCPYRFNKKLGIEQSRIACIERPLTEEEKTKLREINERIARTKWDRWTKGNYDRWCIAVGIK